jgi:hypothetical protein
MLKVLQKYLPWIIFSLLAYYLVGSNFSAKLGMIDDHETAWFLGQDGKITLTELPVVIMSTEVGQWGTSTRYRPSYYTLRVIETAMWKNNAFAWYFFRYLILVISMVLGWKILVTYFPKIIAYLFIFYVLTMPFWPDMLTRLGPSEIYALPALLLFVYGLIKNKFWMIFVGYTICVGGKENLLILLPILGAWLLVKTKELSKYEWLMSLLLLAYTAFITTGILIATNNSGVDFYLNDISYTKRLVLTIQSIPEIVDSRHLLIPLLMFSVLSVYANKKYFWLGITLLLCALTQYVFYNNRLPSNTRYDFPALLLFPVFDLLVVKMLTEVLKKYPWGKLLNAVCYTGLSLFMIAFVVHRGYFLLHDSAHKNVEKTIRFDESLVQAARFAKDNPDATLVFSSTHFTDFEPIVAVSRYLTSMEIKNNMVISYTKEVGLQDTLGLHLEDRMMDSMQGDAQIDATFERFQPLSSLSKECYTISLYGAPEYGDCEIVAKF